MNEIQVKLVGDMVNFTDAFIWSSKPVIFLDAKPFMVLPSKARHGQIVRFIGADASVELRICPMPRMDNAKNIR